MSPALRRALLAAAVAAPLVVFAYFAITLAMVPSELGYDESIYAIGARGWITGEGLDWFPYYRPVGMRLLAAPGWLAGGDVADFRVVAALYSTICVIVFWGLGRRIAGAAAASIAIAMFTTSVEIQLRAAEILSDLPSLTLVFALLWIVIRELERDGGPRWPFVLAGPLAAGSFYVRYGSTLILVAIAVAALVLYFPVVRRHWKLVAITAGVFVACMIPHLLHSAALTGSPTGVMRGANIAAGRRYYGEGLWYLYRHFPDKPGGMILALVAFVGVGSGLMYLLRRRADALHRRLGFVWLAALLHTLAVGFDVHGQARFVFFGAFLFTLIGAHALVRLVDGVPRRRWLEVAIPAAAVVWLIALEAHRDAIRHNARDLRSNRVLREAAEVIAADSRGEGCAVMSPLIPQMTWLSNCSGHSTTSNNLAWVFERMRARDVPHEYVVLLARAPRNPKDQRLADIMARVELPAIAEIPDEAGTWGDATIYRFRR